MKNYVAQYVYDNSGKVEYMFGFCYGSEKDAEIVAKKTGGVVMSPEEFEAESDKYGLN